MTHLAIENALLAWRRQRHCGRPPLACTRTTARRERQVVEIAALVVAGDRDRAVGLALEHTVDFPEDAELLARVAPTGN